MIASMIFYAGNIKTLKTRSHVYFIDVIEEYISTSYVPEQKSKNY